MAGGLGRQGRRRGADVDRANQAGWDASSRPSSAPECCINCTSGPAIAPRWRRAQEYRAARAAWAQFANAPRACTSRTSPSANSPGCAAIGSTGCPPSTRTSPRWRSGWPRATDSDHPRMRAAIAGGARRPRRVTMPVRHTPPARFTPRQALALKAPCRREVRPPVLPAREPGRALAVRRSWRRRGATIPAAYTDSPYPLQYYFEFRTSPDKAFLHPGFARGSGEPALFRRAPGTGGLAQRLDEFPSQPGAASFPPSRRSSATTSRSTSTATARHLER